MTITKPVLTQAQYADDRPLGKPGVWKLLAGDLGLSSYGPTSYELRVRHEAPEDAVAFLAWQDGEAMELVTQDEYAARRDAVVLNEGHGPCASAGCANPEGATWQVGLRGTSYCADHAPAVAGERRELTEADALNRADALLADRCRVMERSEAEVLRQLHDYWTAVSLLVVPAVSL